MQLEFTEPIYPGLVFSVSVSKVDFYNQTVSSDSSTFLKFHTMPAASSNSSIVPSLAAEVSGDAVFQLVGGLLKVDLALLPYFSVIRADSGLILHAGDVVLYAEGLDDLSSIILRCPFSPSSTPLDPPSVKFRKIVIYFIPSSSSSEYKVQLFSINI